MNITKIGKIISYILASFIAILLLAGIAITTLVHPEQFRGIIEKKFSEQTGYNLAINGDINLKIMAMTSKITVTDAVITDPMAKQGTPALIKMKTLKLGVNWHDLLRGVIGFNNVELDQPNIHITAQDPNTPSHPKTTKQAQTNNTANTNTSRPAQTRTRTTTPTSQQQSHPNKITPSESPDIHIKNFVIKDADFRYDNPSSKTSYRLNHINLENNDFTLNFKHPDQSGKLIWLHRIVTNGRLQLGEIWLGQWHLHQVDIHYNLSDGQLTLSPIHYQFNSTPGLASFLLFDKTDHVHLALKNHLDDANLVYRSIEKTDDNKTLAFATMPLLLDIQSGKISVNTDIHADIENFDSIGKKLNGDIKLELRDGTINRFNLGYELQRLENKINRVDDNQENPDKTTKFDIFKVDITLKNGVAQDFPVQLQAPSFSFNGTGNINMRRQPAWLRINALIKPKPGKYKKLEQALNQYLTDDTQGSIPLQFYGPLYQPSKLAIKVDQNLAEKILKNFFKSWPDSVKKKIISKIQTKLKKSLSKMQKRLNQGPST